MTTITYKDAGVDIQAGNDAVASIKPLVKKTFSPHVITELGAFGSMFDLKALLADYKHPVMVQSIDGVGTKTMIAKRMQKFDTLGIDLVSATANDIIVMGAKPVTLLDYIAADRLDPKAIESIVRGMAKACLENNISLVGGETAEMPGTYQPGEYDLAGVITGIVEKDKAILGQSIAPGDLVFGINASGLHTNGYSLARKLFFDTARLDVDSTHPELDKTVGETLLEPHINYTRPIMHLIDNNIEIKGMAHITGGGFIENIPRILPNHCGVEIRKGTWSVPPVFQIMQQIGKLQDHDMFQTFNMGIGMVLVVSCDMGDKLAVAMKHFPQYSLHHLGDVYCSSTKAVRIV